MALLFKSCLKSLALVSACVVLATPLEAEDGIPASCGAIDQPMMARHCMLTRQIEDTRVGGDRVAGVFQPQVTGNLVTPEVRAGVLNARAQMLDMVSDADDEGVLLGPVGSVGNAPVFGALIGLVIVFVLFSGDSEPPLFGPPLSPS